MNTYEYLKTIDLQKIYLIENDDETIAELKIIGDALQSFLLKDFDAILDDPKEITLTEIEYENPDYRQSATGIIFRLSFPHEESFQLHIEVLIDSGRILVGMKGNPKSDALKRLYLKIKSNYNSELKTDLKLVQ
ncbi:hypothetical protein [Sphingobacterium yanglingense]|uniref:Uncharacterized protein n=1 Tax=Sphingobacterium yanglingense TaxID=1437280 RepID=A0A4R6WK00_9SPHI|nr:hypothetical protein [Sphingobacterium yanglingense]TDQ78324.1 hypothetical protein CLV99_2307 [Sphingobacterium yanglingense]